MRVVRGVRPSRPVYLDGRPMPDDLWTLVTSCWAGQPSERPLSSHVVRGLSVIRFPPSPPSHQPQVVATSASYNSTHIDLDFSAPLPADPLSTVDVDRMSREMSWDPQVSSPNQKRPSPDSSLQTPLPGYGPVSTAATTTPVNVGSLPQDSENSINAKWSHLMRDLGVFSPVVGDQDSQQDGAAMA